MGGTGINGVRPYVKFRQMEEKSGLDVEKAFVRDEPSRVREAGEAPGGLAALRR